MGDSTKSINSEYSDEFGSIIPPIYISSIYRYIDEDTSKKSDRNITIKYYREENPSLRILEKVLSSLEGSEDSLVFSSGMAAISTIAMNFLKKKSKVLLLKEMYGSTIQLFENLSNKFDITIKKVYPNHENIIEELEKNTYDLAIIESITNPTLKVIDISKIGDIIKKLDTNVVVDNTFATPILLKPSKYGFKLILNSTTKYLSGHNDTMGGSISGKSDLINELWEWRRLLGNIQQPFEAYLTLRGIKTLPIRIKQQSENALAISEFLADNSKISRVLYPGLKDSEYNKIALKIFEKPYFGGVLSFEIKGDLNQAKDFLRNLKIIKPSPSLGGTESIATLPSITASRYIDESDKKELGISEKLIRLSVGLEDTDDLINDIQQALNKI
ncbi:cystathionine beta-lyase/cystathionine gamma-synthase [Caldisphaera lagunensis DSM 15908]|uniref:Cystathionine beta-lyase/cystathionine gamma-synthase n=1 Tax=Caldisphaera lagunensis (strain DSM 15908 / JCM 11604 / ANMR 0165 / IC-154) TaxID=1056495 RepID=L0A9T9_CALLD|nr:cystathionine gamma-synthase family protein [Caldisphaera lagunensis]AFZ70184.1 cystathionine beta-lyase/cystathionine gamma-synthase [Caldisphaera lagunensis DSM 15908]